MARFKYHSKIGKLALFLVVMLALLFAKTLYQILTAPTIKAVDLEQIALFFNSNEYPDRYNKDIWEKYSKCADMFCWSHYTLSPLFPHFFEIEWTIDVSVFHLYEDKLKNSPYQGHSIKKDRVYNVYWIDDYGPFKIELSGLKNEQLLSTIKTRPYNSGVDNPREINDISWSTSLSENKYIITPHKVSHNKESDPKLEAYRNGNRIVIKDVFESGDEWTVISGEISLESLPKGEYEILYISDESGIPNTGGGTSEMRNIVGYTKFTKHN